MALLGCGNLFKSTECQLLSFFINPLIELALYGTFIATS